MVQTMATKQNTSAALAVDFCGLKFNSPIVLLSGCVGFGDEYTRVEGFSHSEVGAVCLKGITLKPRLGNPPPRVVETPQGMINSIGLQNPGVESFINDILPKLDFSETRFIANVSGTTVDEYADITRRLDQSPIDAIEINVSCPNIREGGLSFGNYPRMTAQVVAACRAATSKPLITKLSPNQTDIAASAKHSIDAGSDALSVINTVLGMEVDVATRRPVVASNHGGLSGRAIKPIALYCLHQVREVCKTHDVPIIGQGGVVLAEDALEFLITGATAVGIGTGLFYDPLLCPKVNRAIATYLEENNLSQVHQAVGTIQLNTS